MTYEELLDKVKEEGIELFENNYIGKLKGLYLGLPILFPHSKDRR